MANKKENQNAANVAEGVADGNQNPDAAVGTAVQSTEAATPPTNDNEQETVENQSLDGNGNSEETNAEQTAEAAAESKTEAVAEKGNNAKYSELKRIAKDVFKNYPNKNVLYFTMDKIPFFEKNDAVKHSLTLKNQIIVEIKNV